MLRARVRDVAIPARYGDETPGVSVLSTGMTFPIPMFYVLHDFSPIALFLFLGLGLSAWGGLCGMFVWIRSSVTAHAATTRTVMLAVLPLIMGFQLLLQAIVLDIQGTRRR